MYCLFNFCNLISLSDLAGQVQFKEDASNQTHWCFFQYIKRSDLLDPAQGYIQSNGTLIILFQVCVFVVEFCRLSNILIFHPGRYCQGQPVPTGSSHLSDQRFSELSSNLQAKQHLQKSIQYGTGNNSLCV